MHNMCAMARSGKFPSMPRELEGVDFKHIRDNHFVSGSGFNSTKDPWPASMSDDQLRNIAQQALKNNPSTIGWDSQTGMLQGRSTVNGIKVQFQISKSTGIVRSIYPLSPWPAS